MLPQLIDPTQSKPRIARSPEEASDYRPDWRFQLFQQYSLRITSAGNRVAELRSILVKEKDIVLRQVLLYHFNPAPVVSRPIKYAITCHATNSSNRIASSIRAMIVAGRTLWQIVSEIGGDPICIAFYAQLFWDVAKYRDHRTWLKRLCFPPQGNYATVEEECEARWLQIAFLRGWAGLCQALSGRIPPSRGNMKAELDNFMGSLISRATDYLTGLDSVGIPPTERDLQLLALVQHRLKESGITFSPVDIGYAELPTPDEQRKKEKAKEIVGGLSLAARKVLVRLLQTCEAIAQDEEAANKETERAEI